MKKLSYTSRLFITYAIINVVLIGLSFFGFMFGEKLLPVCVAICSITGFGCLLSLVRGSENLNKESSKAAFAPYLILRYVLMIIGLVACAFIIKFTMGEVVNKYRYLLVVIAAIPYFSTSISILLTKTGDKDVK